MTSPAGVSAVVACGEAHFDKAMGGRWLLVQAEKGFLALVLAKPEQLDEVARLEALHSKTWNPPTLAGRWLLARNDREAVCFEIPAK